MLKWKKTGVEQGGSVHATFYVKGKKEGKYGQIDIFLFLQKEMLLREDKENNKMCSRGEQEETGVEMRHR